MPAPDHLLQVVSPETMEVVGSVTTVDPSAAQEIVAEAALAQRGFGPMPPDERCAMLGRAARALERRAGEVADVVVAETGKPRVEAFTSEVLPALDALVWLERAAARLLAPERVRFHQLHLRHDFPRHLRHDYSHRLLRDCWPDCRPAGQSVAWRRPGD